MARIGVRMNFVYDNMKSTEEEKKNKQTKQNEFSAFVCGKFLHQFQRAHPNNHFNVFHSTGISTSVHSQTNIILCTNVLHYYTLYIIHV